MANTNGGVIMTQINKLYETIQSQEDSAAKLNHDDANVTEASDTGVALAYYKELYELLSVAYFASKDLNVLLEGNVTPIEDNASEVALSDAQATIATLEVGLEVANKEVSNLSTKLDISDRHNEGLISKLAKIVNIAK